MQRALLALIGVLTLTAAIAVVAQPSALAANQVIVTESNPQGWCWTPPCADTRTGGDVNFVDDPTAPGSPNRGAMQLITDATTTAKAQAVHTTNTPLADVTELSYWTRQVSGPPHADPAYQLALCLNGATATTCSGFTTLVFEPYQNPAQGPIVPNVWQDWDVDAGLFWSTRTVTCSNGVILGSAGGPATYTLAAVQAACPDALVFQFIVNVGSNNPLYNVYVDLFNFNGTVYNFEPDLAGCHKPSHGKGHFKHDHEGNGHFEFKHCKRDGGEDEASFDSADRGDGRAFQSTSITSAVVDQDARTITMTGVGTTTGGLPVTFVLVALETTALTPGWVSMTFGDGYTSAGNLLSGEVILGD